MKLVEGGKGGRDGELPAAETCGLDDEDEEEEDQQFDSVEFKSQSKTSKLFGKLKSSLGKRVSWSCGAGVVRDDLEALV